VRLQPLGHLSREESAAALRVGGKLLQESLDRQPKYAAIKFPLILWPEPLKPQGADVETHLEEIVILRKLTLRENKSSHQGSM
jgi:hypothetical protein